MSDYCIIGGGGFIGTHIIKQLCEKKAGSITVIGRRPVESLSMPGNVNYVQGDYKDPETLKKIISDSSKIIHLAYASVPKTSFDHPVMDILDNLPSTVTLLEEAIKKNVSKLVFVSSGGTVYGDSEGLPLSETHSTAPKSPYGISKLSAEKYMQMYHMIYGLPCVCVRPSNAYGPGQLPFRGQGFISTAMASIIQGKELSLFGKRGTVRDYIYVTDLAAGIIAALENGVPGEIYNIGTGIGMDNMQILDEISKYCKQEIKINFMPERSFDVNNNILDSSKLMKASGWKPEISIESGIKHTWNYIQTYLKDTENQ